MENYLLDLSKELEEVGVTYKVNLIKRLYNPIEIDIKSLEEQYYIIMQAKTESEKPNCQSDILKDINLRNIIIENEEDINKLINYLLETSLKYLDKYI